MESQNPYTAMKGYEVQDDSGARVGEIGETVYDEVSDVLKYIVVRGHTILADRIEVDVEEECIRVPYDRETIETAPPLKDFSGEFDRALRAHYDERG